MERVTTEDKLFHFRPVFFTGAFLSVGIWFYYLHIVYGVSVWWCFLLLFTLAPLFFNPSKKRVREICVASLIMVLAFFTGFFSFMLTHHLYTKAEIYNAPCTVYGKVVEISEDDDKFCVVLDKLTIDGKVQKGRLIAYLSTPYAGDFTLPHTLGLTGEVGTLAKGGLQDTISYMREDVRYHIYADSYTVGGRSFDMFLWARVRVHNVLQRGMSKESASVTMAILTGDTTGIETGLLQNIRYGGIAHIFAVSGLHVGALYAFCLALFSKTRLKRAPKCVRFFTVATLLGLYGGLCGFSPSITRAVVMCLSFYLCRLWLYGSDTLERVGLAGVLVLLLSPTALFEAGFGLSFSACLGIVLLSRPLNTLCNAVANVLVPPRPDADDHPRGIGRRVFDSCASLFCVSLSAQIATAPLLLHTFGYLSGWALVFNLVFVPLISFAFSVLLALTLIACLLPLCVSAYILYVPSVAWSALLLIFHACDLSRFALSGIRPSRLAMYFYGFTWSFLTDKWNVGKRMRILLFGLLFFCFVFSCFFL